MRIAARTGCALVLGWTTAFLLWPWLQIGNPLAQFKVAFELFANHPNSFEMPVWGVTVRTTDLPWWYVPGQLLARLPEGFLVLLTIGILSAAAADCAFLRATIVSGRAATGWRDAAMRLARSRRHLLIWAAVVLPLGFIIARHSTLYDGVRHVLFVIPMLAAIAAAGFLRLRPVARRFPLIAAAIGGIYLGLSIWTLAALHPLEYVATNALAGGVAGAQGRFDLDYWAVAATVALRRLESRLDYERRFAKDPPSLTICMTFREGAVAPLYRRPWRLETEPKQADYIIATERWPCADDIADAVLIDEVRRFDRPFARIYARPSRYGPAHLATAAPR
jgi:hypothetical protein